MAVNQEAADALTNEVKDLVKDLQQKNTALQTQVDSLVEYTENLEKQILDMQNKEYDI